VTYIVLMGTLNPTHSLTHCSMLEHVCAGKVCVAVATVQDYYRHSKWSKLLLFCLISATFSEAKTSSISGLGVVKGD